MDLNLEQFKQIKTRVSQSLGYVLCAGSFLICPTLNAQDFYTIIGPDGRPIVIERSASSAQKNESIKNRKSIQRENVQPKIIQKKPADEPKKILVEIAQPSIKAPTASKSVGRSQNDNVEQSTVSVEIKTQDQMTKIDLAQTKVNTKHEQSLTKNKSTHDQNSKEKVQRVEQISDSKKAGGLLKVETGSPVTLIDGVEYIDHEYLEDHEFNLEGRKRFYVVPDTQGVGAARFETIERQKGIAKAVLSQFLQPTEPAAKEAMALSSTYMRIEAKDLAESLEHTCFQDKKIQKAKRLKGAQSEIGLWPVAPLKERFAYEVVELDESIDQIQIQSFASSQNNPTFYWPIAVFLDQQGCILEGATGFKSTNTQANVTTYSALEGILKKPPQTRYLLLTPLVESIDIQNQKLVNTGQLKLKAIK